MDLDYGFAKIEIGDDEYILKPTLKNIRKIGTPKEIIKLFSTLHYKAHHYVTSFGAAADILNHCGLPRDVTGTIDYSVRSGRRMINPGYIPPSDVFTLAEHCLAHGVVGVVDHDDDDSDKTGETLEEFDAHSFIVDATEYLGMTLSEAEQLTMTQFVFLVKAKNKNYEKRAKEMSEKPKHDKASEKDIKEAMEFYNEKVKKINEANMSKQRRLTPEEIDKMMGNK